MHQSGDFVYEEGDRKARATKATMDSDQNVILLEGAARVSDATGSTNADHIRLDQRTGDFTADEKVVSSRMPDRDPNFDTESVQGLIDTVEKLVAEQGAKPAAG